MTQLRILVWPKNADCWDYLLIGACGKNGQERKSACEGNGSLVSKVE